MVKATPYFVSASRPTVPTQTTSPTLGQSMKDGFGLGVGVSIADRLVGAIFGPRQVQMVHILEPKSKEAQTVYERCLELTLGREEACAHLKESKST
jgi:hypothetical protein